MAEQEEWSPPLPDGVPEEREWPNYVAYALDAMLCSFPEDVEEMSKIEQRWGGLELEHFRRALHGNDKKARLYALFALGFTQSPEARVRLLPFLESPEPLERWASAIELGHMREQQALPVLFAMLTDYLPPNEPRRPNGEKEWYFESWRFSVPRLLSAWGQISAVPPLRHALLEMIRIRETLIEPSVDAPRAEHSAYRMSRDRWRRYQDALIYALGRLGAFGALTGLPLSGDELGIWRIHLIMGYLHGRYPLETVVRWKDVPALQEDVKHLLERFFGLDVNERELHMAQYERRKLSSVALAYLTQQKQKEHGWPD